MLSTARVPVCLLFLPIAACSCEGEGELRNVAPKLKLSSELVDFGEVAVNDLRVRGLTLENEGSTALEIKAFSLEGAAEISVASDRPTLIAPGGKVEVSFAYEPIDVGEDKATLTIESNDAMGPHTVSLRGIGVMGGVALSHDGEACGTEPDSISFGATAPGSTVERTITLRSAGTAAFRVLSAVREPGTTLELEIDEIPAGGSEIAPGSELALKARYKPIDGGTDRGAFVITTDLADRPSIRIVICGEGIAPAICARPVPLDFGAVAQGSRVTQRLTIESCGRETLELGAIAIANDAAHPSHAGFAIAMSPSLPRTMAPGETTEVEVSFEASMIGSASGFVRATSNALGNAEAFFALTARGAQPCSLYVAPPTVTYSNVAQGSSADQQVLIANDGASSCRVTRLEITQGASEFRLGAAAPMVPLDVPAGGSIALPITYAPSASPAPHNGVLEIEGNGAVVPVTLIGNPMLADGCQLEVVPTILSFGAVAPGTTRSMGVEVRNISQEFCTIRGVMLAQGSDPAFINTSSNFGLVLPGRSKQLTVTYQPASAGAARGELVIDTSDVDSPEFRVPIFASSAQSGICVSPRILPFGPATGVETMDFTIYACGGSAVTIQALDWTAPDPELALQSPPSLPFTLQAGASQQVFVRYSPADAAGDYAALTVRSNDPVEPAIRVEMTGGQEVVPTEAGRFLYYWSIPSPIGGDIMKLPLQGVTMSSSFWGPRSGKQCTGCHHVSPDGRYVALIEFGSSPFMQIIDTTNNVSLQLPQELRAQVSYFSWRPNVNTLPAYQFAYDSPGGGGNYKIHIGSVFGGYIGELQGANDPNVSQLMPSWGPNGKIAFVRGMTAQQTQGGAAGFSGPTDVMLIDENGGTPTPLQGASANGGASYYPAYSPNGQWIAVTFSASAQGTIAAADAQLRLIPATQSGSPSLLPNANVAGTASSYPTWSVDGRFLSFSSNRPGGAGDWDIYLAPIDPMTGRDGAATNLTQANTPGFEHAAQWSP
jgi:hypothetical protein